MLVTEIGAIQHVFVLIVGGEKGFDQTIKAVLYGSTPNLLIGWIPLIGGIIGGIWSLILYMIGIRESHKISNRRAILAVLLPIIVSVVIVIAVILAFIFGMADLGVMPSFPLNASMMP